MTVINTVTILGNPGADTINAPTNGLTSAFVINALGGADYIEGGSFNDRINAGAGNDTAYGRGGNDRITGGGGGDVIFGGGGNDTAQGDDGNDVMFGDAGNDRLTGGAGKDTIDGGSGDDLISGGAGDDHLFGGDSEAYYQGVGTSDLIPLSAFDDPGEVVVSGNTIAIAPVAQASNLTSLGVLPDGDAIFRVRNSTAAEGTYTLANSGGSPSYTFDVPAQSEVYVNVGPSGTYILDVPDSATNITKASGPQSLPLTQAGGGDDTIYGDGGDDKIEGLNGDDVIYGGNGNDTASGGSGDDIVNGGNGDDDISGNGGDDVLNGNDGFDFYTGNGGDDRFVFDAAGTSSEPEEDAITDFTFGDDKIDLTAFNLADWTGSDSQITVVNEGTVPGLPLGSNIKTIYVDLNDDNNAGNNTTHAEVVIYVNAGIAGFVRDFAISDSNPFADILV